ncbi:hypothetical protein [Phyllobacterium zundukense]|uniref:hypothetical protein n=1 Tax=Phyllobacterium zundukense TaxID=1867719 RepID=UPI0010551E04|nr:hypothetical protein [Phyllobacterium zundukense]
MMEKARNLGLGFRDRVDLDTNSYQAPIADSYKMFMAGNYSRIKKPFDRVIGGEPVKGDDFTESNINETIDGSVFDRWRADPNYRPPSLIRWANSRAVDLTTILGAVRADPSLEKVG